jgi:hypothetical protein
MSETQKSEAGGIQPYVERFWTPNKLSDDQLKIDLKAVNMAAESVLTQSAYKRFAEIATHLVELYAEPETVDLDDYGQQIGDRPKKIDFANDEAAALLLVQSIKSVNLKAANMLDPEEYPDFENLLKEIVERCGGPRDLDVFDYGKDIVHDPFGQSTYPADKADNNKRDTA